MVAGSEGSVVGRSYERPTFIGCCIAQLPFTLRVGRSFLRFNTVHRTDHGHACRVFNILGAADLGRAASVQKPAHQGKIGETEA